MSSYPHTLTPAIILIVVLLVLSALFSACETALTGVSRAQFYRLKKSHRRRFNLIKHLIQKREEVIGVLLIGNNLANIFASVFTTALCVAWFGREMGIVWASLFMSVVVILLAEILPKTYAVQNNASVVQTLAPFIFLVRILLFPLSFVLNSIVRFLRSLWPGKRTRKRTSAREELRGVIDLHHEEGRVVKLDKDMLGGILSLKDLTVGDVVVHRKNLFSLNADQPTPILLDEILRSSHTRIPLWRNNPENIVGIVHVKDLLRHLYQARFKIDGLSLLKFAQKPWFVPEYTHLQDQLNAFLKEKRHFALVVDEYGALMGLVTLEDILEEIVGDIVDEHDQSKGVGIYPQNNGSFVVFGDTPIRDINRFLDLEFPDDEATTLAGLIIHIAHSIPEVGQSFSSHNFLFTVLKKQNNQITLIRMRSLALGDADAGELDEKEQ